MCTIRNSKSLRWKRQILSRNLEGRSSLSVRIKLEIYNGEKTASSISGAGKIGQLHVKNEIRTLPNTIHKNKLKMD